MKTKFVVIVKIFGMNVMIWITRLSWVQPDFKRIVDVKTELTVHRENIF